VAPTRHAENTHLSGKLYLHGNGRDAARISWLGLPAGSAKQIGERYYVATGRLSGRTSLLQQLAAGQWRSGITDAELIGMAYQRWGENAPERLVGDWAFAVWSPDNNELFLARDPSGNTSLYYYADADRFAFSSSRQVLLDLKLAPHRFDELYLAQVLTVGNYHGDRTIHPSIKRLPPAHCLTVGPKGLRVRRYWTLEETPILQLRDRREYAEAFTSVFEEAVRDDIGDDETIGATLSGGLDSGAVVTTAARILRAARRPRLQAFTSIPLYDTRPFLRGRFGDEYPLAQITAAHTGHVDLYHLESRKPTPIQAIRRKLEIHNEPQHAACNAYWIIDFLQAARARECRVLLTGQLGNGGISWKGALYSQPLAYQLRAAGWSAWFKGVVNRHAPHAVLLARRRAKSVQNPWRDKSAINPDFARRVRLDELNRADPEQLPARTPIDDRSRIVMPGRALVGGYWAEMGAAFGISVRDPTADARVLQFAFSVPDHIFIDPATGMDRWLIREAMKGRLPDEVRLNRRRGRQAADLVPRLRATAWEVEQALDECARGPAAEYVDVPYMRETWQYIQTHDTPEAFRKAVTILTRGVMAGLWVNRFYGVETGDRVHPNPPASAAGGRGAAGRMADRSGFQP
jgi:asparagine synthase (glutamine-hydrolysing)